MNDRTNRLALLVLAGVAGIQPASAGTSDLLAFAQNPSMDTNFILLGMAIVQAIIIVTLSGIMKALGGNGKAWLGRNTGRNASMILVTLFAGMGTEAHAATSGIVLMTSQNLFWYLLAANMFFLLIIVAQLLVLRGLVRALAGEPTEQVEIASEETPSFADTLLSKLTKRVEADKEKDILMHHEYDGIRELDNVLPPWWLWLFYGTIAWSVVFLVGKHVVNVIPHQDELYVMEVEQAAADIEAYLALQAAAVDENTVVALTDAGTLGTGKAIFTEFCRACHGELGEGNAVGPNLTDAYWINGGSINAVFRTIKYGVVAKGMQSWKNELNPQQMQAVASYIMSLQGTEPPNAREPQGELYVPQEGAPEEPGTGDSTTVAAASVALVQ